MVQRLSRTLLLTLLLPSLQLAAAPATPDNWHYRQAAWAFYLQQPAQALDTAERMYRDARLGSTMLPWSAEVCLERLGAAGLYD